MATIQKFYLHDATSTDTGTLPTTWQGTPLGANEAGATTARAMDDVKGAAQVAITGTTMAAGIAHWYRQFVSAPLAAQTIGVGTWTLLDAIDRASGAGDVSNTGLAFIWRPSTGTKVGTLWDDALVPVGAFAVTTTPEIGSGGNRTGASVTTQDGDILVVQIALEEESGLGSSVGKLFYDGTTDPIDNTNTSDAASYLNAPAPITMQPTGPPPVVVLNFGYGPN